jgi:decaprenylphospho-beta-D-ribofuranose 2-oxidase
MTVLSGWGRYPRFSSETAEPLDLKAASQLMLANNGIVARGRGRAYGDAAIGEKVTFCTRNLNHIRRLALSSGIMRAEAGVVLSDILDLIVPQNYFVPVVPGTRFVTLGGMIAADVHGKNHHRDGGFGNCVEELTLLLPDGTTVRCSRTEHKDLFSATIGGMGLTGTIVEVTFRLLPIETAWMRQTTLIAADIETALDLLQQEREASYSVAWIDCLAQGKSLGRSVIFVAEHATREDVDMLGIKAHPPSANAKGGLSVPVDLPQFLLNRVSVGAFNEMYFRLGARKAGITSLVPWQSYFFPLDSIGNWNRMYGKAGFVQYQCVLPTLATKSVLPKILERLSRFGVASFLSVLKQLGPAHGNLSFPLEGFTLALDLPIKDGVFKLLDELDMLVVNAGGRLYLAKDARQSREIFENSYDGLGRFRDVRKAISATERISSRLSMRLGI